MPRNLVHGRKGRVWLDDPAGALVEISGVVDKCEVKGEGDRPETQGSGHDGKRYGTLGKTKGDVSMSGKIAVAASLARIHGRKGRWLLGGTVLSRSVKSGSIDVSCDLPATSGAEDAERYEVSGFTDGSVSMQGHADYGVGEVVDRVKAALAADPDDGPLPYAALGIRGLALGAQVEFWQAAVTSVTDGHDNSQPNSFSAESKAHDGIWLGQSLHDLVAQTDPAPLNGSSLDDVSATTAGARVRVHVTDIQGATPSATFKFQTSVDGIAWVDAATFTAMTGIGAQEVLIAQGVTLNRYMRIVLSAGSYDSITFTAFVYRSGATNVIPGGYRHFRSLLQQDASSSFKHHPDGSGTGKRETTGECRLGSLKLSFNTDQVTTFEASFMLDGAAVVTHQA